MDKSDVEITVHKALLDYEDRHCTEQNRATQQTIKKRCERLRDRTQDFSRTDQHQSPQGAQSKSEGATWIVAELGLRNKQMAQANYVGKATSLAELTFLFWF